MIRTIKRVVLGSPFPSSRALHERLDKLRGLAVFASDPISSNAYATEAIMSVLVVLGAGALRLTLPIALGIAGLVAVVIVSYSQTVQHYPHGGGAYKVAKNHLGTLPALVAAAALLSDYVLTVAVSVSAAMRAAAAALPTVPAIHEYRVILGMSIIGVLTWLNLRGARESGTLFAIPTYAFVAGMLVVIAVGVGRVTGLVGDPLPVRPVTSDLGDLGTAATLWLVLRAVAAGCTALTGIEAISDGVPAFRPPALRNATVTMWVMGLLAMTIFVGLSYLATALPIVPHTESVLAQVSALIVGRGALHTWVLGSAMLILVLAANTAYQDFPRLSALLAQDDFLPHWMNRLGDRLVYSGGIVLLGLLASLLVVMFAGDELRLLPLYALGVFTSFTLSQAGMVRLWGRVAQLQPGERLDLGDTVLQADPRWRWKQIPNLIGVAATGLVLPILGITKFADGAWIIVVVLPLLVLLFLAIRRHYASVAPILTDGDLPADADAARSHVVIVPVAGIHRVSLRAVAYACRLAPDVRVVQVIHNPAEADETSGRWQHWCATLAPARLVLLPTEYRDVLVPLLRYIHSVRHEAGSYRAITVVVPEIVPDSWPARLLHAQTGLALRLRLHHEPDVVLVTVPVRVGRRLPT